MDEELIGDLKSKDEKVAALRKLYESCDIGELRRYKQEVVMQKLNEEFELKREKMMMEFCKELIAKYENGTLF